MSDMATDRISIRLNPQLRRRLEKRAAVQGASESEIVREAVEAYLQGAEGTVTCYDLALKAGIIGRIKQSATDISTNRKHFRGFGR
jgi:predicted DNA-binding protein